ncbi:ferric reductase family protein [Aspergillus saccharolyticus JOP 1030-1]|uniref:ferric-chelate reductase (NADPH) n=1 Tax=Aspergillus saccharolyticus JOP 1030-1 TaxID=1450539 RepID=A0A318ZAA8_9EURO|nr:putative ferric-chelate reductase [Aspergillus saccharolyticus JOP 1030-1]PYH41643.1 putative ferric-chelate reductase [Aspergillus saccharolyticus JOP 1030-1]
MGVDYHEPGQPRFRDVHPPMKASLATPVFVFAGGVFVLFLGSMYTQLQHRRRLRRILESKDDDQDRYAQSNALSATLNKHVFYAPLLSTRHSREFRLGSCHMGIIPLRLEAILLSLYMALNVGFFFATVDWWADWGEVMYQLQYTSGTLAVLNLPGLILTAGRNNPLIPLLGIKFDTFNLIHRWAGRLVVVASTVHVVLSIIPRQKELGGLSAVTHLVWNTPFFVYGMTAFIAFAAILVQSISPLRHAFYEAFLHLHILLAIASMVGLWYHLRGMSQQTALLVTLILWGFDRAARLFIIIWRNVGKQRTTATVELLPGDVARVSVALARPWTFKAGQYMYLYLPSLGLWTSHPFSVAWTASDRSVMTEKRSSNDSINRLLGGPQQTTMSFLIKRRDGFTGKLLSKVHKSCDGRFQATALAEGPFGGLHSLASYGTVLLIAGGIGITHPMSYLHEFVNNITSQTQAVRRVTLVWVVRSLDHLSWIQPWMTSLLNHPALQMATLRKAESYFQFPEFSLNVQIYVSSSSACTSVSSADSSSAGSDASPTRPDTSPEEFLSDSSPWAAVAPPSVPVNVQTGKPCFRDILAVEMAQQVGAMAVSICGPGAMGDDVRRTVRECQGRGPLKVELFEESFSW